MPVYFDAIQHLQHNQIKVSDERDLKIVVNFFMQQVNLDLCDLNSGGCHIYNRK